MEHITISVSELYQKAKEMLNDGMDYVEIGIDEADDELPPAVYFQAWTRHAPEMGVDYEVIEEAELQG